MLLKSSKLTFKKFYFKAQYGGYHTFVLVKILSEQGQQVRRIFSRYDTQILSNSNLIETKFKWGLHRDFSLISIVTVWTILNLNLV